MDLEDSSGLQSSKLNVLLSFMQFHFTASEKATFKRKKTVEEAPAISIDRF